MFLEVTKDQSETNVTVLAMHHYHFQYYSTKAALQMMAVCLVVFLAAVFLIMGLPFLEKNFFGILAVIAPIILFYNQRDRVVKEGEAELNHDFVRIAIQGREENVYFSDLKSYRIDHNNGAKLTLHFRDGRRKLTVGANGLYNDPSEFERFCNHFERVVIVHNRDVANKVVRKIPFMLNSYTLIGLLGLTFALIALFAVSMSNGKELRGSFYLAVFTVLALWFNRYTAAEKEKRYQRAFDELSPVNQ
jgi:hypothetical protein